MDTSAEVDPGRRAAFESAVDEVYEPVQRYLRRRCDPHDADEVLNDTLLTIWRRLEDMPADRRLPWTYGVARLCLANHRRGIVRRLRLAGRAADETAVTPTNDWTTEADALLHEAMDRLREDDREVIRLWAWERLEPREIAAVLGTSPNAISVRLTKIRRTLESQISGQNRVPGGHEQVDGQREEEQ